jgi:hypothetical protein
MPKPADRAALKAAWAKMSPEEQGIIRSKAKAAKSGVKPGSGPRFTVSNGRF